MTTSNYYINNVLYHLPEYGGVYNTSTISELKFKRFPCFIVSNLSGKGSKGTHWVGIVINKKNIFYFDPLGRKCSSLKIKQFISSMGYKKYKYLKKPIQNRFSIHCGYFVMSYFIALSNKKTTEEYLKMFKGPNLENDFKVKSYVLNFLRDVKYV